MPYLLQDLIQLPLSDRLKVIEMALCVEKPSSFGFQDEHIHNLFRQLTEARNSFAIGQDSLLNNTVFIKK